MRADDLAKVVDIGGEAIYAGLAEVCDRYGSLSRSVRGTHNRAAGDEQRRDQEAPRFDRDLHEFLHSLKIRGRCL